MLCPLLSARCRCDSRRGVLAAGLRPPDPVVAYLPVTRGLQHGLAELLSPLQTDRRRPVPVLRERREVSQRPAAVGKAAGPGQRLRELSWVELASISMS